MVAFHVISLLLVFLVPAVCPQDQVTDTRLDIVFLLDQERANLEKTGWDFYATYSCAPSGIPFIDIATAIRCNQHIDVYQNCSNINMAYSGIKMWMTSFFDKAGADDAQFAVVVGCDVGNKAAVKYQFKDGKFKDRIPDVLDEGESGIKKGCGKNLDQMMHLANEDVFGPKMGHRNGSVAIAIVVSDCVQTTEFEKVTAEFKVFFQKPKSKLFFICVKFKQLCNDAYDLEIQRFKIDTVIILSENQQTSQSMIYLDPNGNSLEVGQRLDQLLPKRSGVKDVNCNESWVYGNCSGSGSCFQYGNWTHHSLPTGNGTNCTEEAPSNRSCPCPPTTAQPTVPPRTWPIYLGVCGGLLFLAVVLIIVFCCIRAKLNKKRTKDVAVAVRVKKAQEKKAEVAVNLSKEQSTMGVGSKVKSVSRKRSMVATVSKRGSVVKSLVKSGSVSKPVGRSAKSITKPTGKESASKSVTGQNAKSIVGRSRKSVASKSVTGQNAKSIDGRSRKSVAPKSVASKSKVSKTKTPVAN